MLRIAALFVIWFLPFSGFGAEELPAKVRAYLGPTPVEGLNRVQTDETGIELSESTESQSPGVQIRHIEISQGGSGALYRGTVRVYAMPHTRDRVEVDLRPTLTELHRRKSDAYWGIQSR